MNSSDHREEEILGLWIREAGVPNVAPEPQYAYRLKKRVLARVRRNRHPAWPAGRRAALYLAGLAASLLVGVVLWHLGSRLSWAQVVTAVRARPWVHAAANLPEGGTHEFWLSPARNVAAMRWGEHAIFEDHRGKIRETFDPQTKTLTREPGSRIGKEQALSLQALFDAIFRGDDTLNNPKSGWELVGQARRNVQEAGRSWVEYQLDLRHDAAAKRLTIRVDPQTRLPDAMTLKTTRDDDPNVNVEPFELKFTFDYPEQGPADINALGVPRTATIDDRVPEGELARLHDRVSESRERFPRSYLAVVAHALRNDSTPLPMFLWRKGEKWRREYRWPVARTPEERQAFHALKPPPAGPNAAAWWSETTKNWRVNPMEICDGHAVYGDTSKTEQATWTEVRNGTGLGSYQNSLPEIQGYPLLPGPLPSRSITLETNPKDGPPDTVLLTARSTTPDGAADNGPIFRYWIAPTRSNLVMRHERIDSNPRAGKPGLRSETFAVEDVAQAPNGIWYPTLVRRVVLSGAQGQEKRTEETWTFSVDFDIEIPDELFEVESSR